MFLCYVIISFYLTINYNFYWYIYKIVDIMFVHPPLSIFLLMLYTIRPQKGCKIKRCVGTSCMPPGDWCCRIAHPAETSSRLNDWTLTLGTLGNVEQCNTHICIVSHPVRFTAELFHIPCALRLYCYASRALHGCIGSHPVRITTVLLQIPCA